METGLQGQQNWFTKLYFGCYLVDRPASPFRPVVCDLIRSIVAKHKAGRAHVNCAVSELRARHPAVSSAAMHMHTTGSVPTVSNGINITPFYAVLIYHR
jgi:hypothetical protein